ncbi:hypothetical protein CYMTET_26996 [Cymbomonas tetramitiformis]|uniref:Uncharacterized protein n=1 Tax=Cymbomonas tetramitiformis TaxID=36881 RepID=A0AAE0KXD1_9CHLO|nr:hypothetical protein CYMTET_26996 [Cymbomonas tetramitiformis]
MRAVVKCFDDLQEQEECINRAKVILNAHFYPEASLEVHRLDPLLARGKCILSEISSDVALDALYSSAVVFAPFENLVVAAQHMLGQDGEALRARADASVRLMQRRCKGYPHLLHDAVQEIPPSHGSKISAGLLQASPSNSAPTDMAKCSQKPDASAWDEWKNSMSKQDLGLAAFKVLNLWATSK